MTPSDAITVRFAKLSERLAVAVREQRVDALVRQAATERPPLADWLNSRYVRCDEFFRCIESARRQAIPVSLEAAPAAAVDCYGVGSRLVSEVGVDDCTAVSNIAGICKAELPGIQHFLLGQTHVPNFYGPGHELFFMFVFCLAGRTGSYRSLLLQRVNDSPAWVSDYMNLSCIATHMGEAIISLIAEAAVGGKSENQLLKALSILTEVPGASSPDYARLVMTWYEGVKGRLTLNPYGLYPAPQKGPMFIMFGR